jgi:hypothetical protein
MNLDIRVNALESLGIKSWEIKGALFTDIIVYDNEIEFNENILNAKIAELTAAEPLRQLRIQRNQLLAQTDWRMVSDYPGSNQTEWQTYRQALRDITTQTPALDENGNLTGITWPIAPND